MKILFSILLLFTFQYSFSQKALLIYGGKNHDVFLGCLNCSNTNSNSIWNEGSSYGSCYNSNSIWDSYGQYGGNYSIYSPFNSYTSCPPVIVDEKGNFYGYFTTNIYKAERANFSLVAIIYKYYDLISKDVPKWYVKIFE